MQEAEDSLLDRLIVELPRNLDLACEQRIAASIFERPQVLAVRRPVDAKEAANESESLTPRRLARTTIDRFRSDRRPSYKRRSKVSTSETSPISPRRTSRLMSF